MNLLLNILWIFLGGGIILFFEYLISGTLLCITIIGIPFGLQCFKLAIFAIAPFGAQAVRGEPVDGCLTTFFNIIWLLIGGLGIALTHVVFALIFAITIIGIPFAAQHMKMAGLALTPFGKRIA
jgi:uncharacterized membrane protein YccF (DUF307 family)